MGDVKPHTLITLDLHKEAIDYARALGLPWIGSATAASDTQKLEGGLVSRTDTPEAIAPILTLLLLEPNLRLSLRNEMQPQRAPIHWELCGPLGSSYSLAIVNEALMSSLAATGEIHQTQPSLRAVLINDFPLGLQSLPHSPLKFLANYAWEESGFPQAWVREINAQLNGLTVCSPLVKKILRSAGVKQPIAVVGNGTDHLPEHTESVEFTRPIGPAHHFRFLHVSSGLPRKGLDSLVSAYAKAFCASDPVTLVIKTQENAENQLAEHLRALQASRPDPPLICVIWEDLSPQEMAALYRACQAFVLTPRAEGFGLPIAEAARYGIPSIVSDFGGHRAFTSLENAILVRTQFHRSQSHLGPHMAPGLEIFDSAWVEPDIDDLAEKLQIMRSLTADARKKIAQTMSEQLSREFKWAKTAQRTQYAVNWLMENACIPKDPKLAWISSHNSRCGIATYSQNLLEYWPGEQPIVLANENVSLIAADTTNVRRCWQTTAFDGAKIAELIREAGCHAVMVQHNPGLFPTRDLSQLLDALDSHKILRYVTLHSTVDTFKQPDIAPSIRNSLQRATRILVHSVADLNLLKKHEIIDNVVLFPHGVYRPASATRTQWAKKWLDQKLTRNPNDFVLASFGFLLPHKGIAELILALSLLRKNKRQVKLLLLNALYPTQESKVLAEEIELMIADLQLKDHVLFLNDFLDEEQAIALLSLADAVIYPYQHSDESASGAVRMAIAAHRPVLTTPVSIFNDIKDQVFQLPGTSAHEVAKGVCELLNDPGLGEEYAQISRRYATTHQWPDLSERLYNLLLGDTNDPFPETLLAPLDNT